MLAPPTQSSNLWKYVARIFYRPAEFGLLTSKSTAEKPGKSLISSCLHLPQHSQGRQDGPLHIGSPMPVYTTAYLDRTSGTAEEPVVAEADRSWD